MGTQRISLKSIEKLGRRPQRFARSSSGHISAVTKVPYVHLYLAASKPNDIAIKAVCTVIFCISFILFSQIYFTLKHYPKNAGSELLMAATTQRKCDVL
jgi:energy-converting hydrogenase Eha subunit C